MEALLPFLFGGAVSASLPLAASGGGDSLLSGRGGSASLVVARFRLNEPSLTLQHSTVHGLENDSGTTCRPAEWDQAYYPTPFLTLTYSALPQAGDRPFGS